MYKALGAKLVVGMPFKDIATSDSLFLRSLPEASDKGGQRALRRLQVGLAAPPPPCSLLLSYQPSARATQTGVW